MIGSNGAGKSTLLNTISGILDVTEGSVEYLGEKITGFVTILTTLGG